MAIKRFIPVQDTFIVSGSIGATLNSGQDPILELGKCSREGTTGSARILIKFRSEDLDFVKSLGSVNYSASLVLYFSEGKRLPASYTIEGTTVDSDWVEGFGHTNDVPPYTEGATWNYGITSSMPWETPTTNTYDGEYSLQNGIEMEISGESAESSSLSSDIEINGGTSTAFFVSQDFTKQSSKDLCVNITEAVKLWEGNFISNDGLVLKLQDESLAESYGTHLSFYSSDTHTVYSPYIQFGWDDSVYEPQEGTATVNINSPAIFTVSNLQSSYYLDEEVQFNVVASPLYPARVFSTSSVYYNSGFVLPEGTCWGIKNEYTNEMVVDFDESFTKVSVSGSQNYFNLDMGVLEPERYYRLLFKVKSNNSDIIIDGRNIFKVIRHGK